MIEWLTEPALFSRLEMALMLFGLYLVLNK